MEFEDEFLEHHGVLGQKWGIRRYQPYPKGKKVKGGKEVGAAKKVEQRAERQSNPRSLSDDELNAKVRRLELEKRYQQLLKETMPSSAKEFDAKADKKKQRVEAGKKFITKVGSRIIEDSLVDIGKQVVNFAAGNIINEAAKKKGYKGYVVKVTASKNGLNKELDKVKKSFKVKRNKKD